MTSLGVVRMTKTVSTPDPATTPTDAAKSLVAPDGTSAPAAPARPRLVGTVVQGRDGGFVIVELPDARMQVVRIGEQAAGLRLRSVSAGEAVFDDQHGTRVSLRTPASGSGSGTRP